MPYKVVDMSEKYAREIMNWRYEGILSIYNLEENEETLKELLTKEYYAVLDTKNNLIGFYCAGEAATVPYGNEFHIYDNKDFLDIGLGLKPEYIGKRYGYPFLNCCLNFLKKKYNVNQFRLTVFDFNKQAINVYHKAGFIIENYFKSENGFYFLVMTLVD